MSLHTCRQNGGGVGGIDLLDQVAVIVIAKAAVRGAADGADRLCGAGCRTARVRALVSSAACEIGAVDAVGAFLPVVRCVGGIFVVGVRVELFVGCADLHCLGGHDEGGALIVGAGEADVSADRDPFVKDVSFGGGVCRDRDRAVERCRTAIHAVNLCLTVGYRERVGHIEGELSVFPRAVADGGLAVEQEHGLTVKGVVLGRDNGEADRIALSCGKDVGGSERGVAVAEEVPLVKLDRVLARLRGNGREVGGAADARRGDGDIDGFDDLEEECFDRDCLLGHDEGGGEGVLVGKGDVARRADPSCEDLALGDLVGGNGDRFAAARALNVCLAVGDGNRLMRVAIGCLDADVARRHHEGGIGLGWGKGDVLAAHDLPTVKFHPFGSGVSGEGYGNAAASLGDAFLVNRRGTVFHVDPIGFSARINRKGDRIQNHIGAGTPIGDLRVAVDRYGHFTAAEELIALLRREGNGDAVGPARLPECVDRQRMKVKRIGTCHDLYFVDLYGVMCVVRSGDTERCGEQTALQIRQICFNIRECVERLIGEIRDHVAFVHVKFHDRALEARIALQKCVPDGFRHLLVDVVAGEGVKADAYGVGLSDLKDVIVSDRLGALKPSQHLCGEVVGIHVGVEGGGLTGARRGNVGANPAQIGGRDVVGASLDVASAVHDRDHARVILEGLIADRGRVGVEVPIRKFLSRGIAALVGDQGDLRADEELGLVGDHAIHHQLGSLHGERGALQILDVGLRGGICATQDIANTVDSLSVDLDHRFRGDAVAVDGDKEQIGNVGGVKCEDVGGEQRVVVGHPIAELHRAKLGIVGCGVVRRSAHNRLGKCDVDLLDRRCKDRLDRDVLVQLAVEVDGHLLVVDIPTDVIIARDLPHQENLARGRLISLEVERIVAVRLGALCGVGIIGVGLAADHRNADGDIEGVNSSSYMVVLVGQLSVEVEFGVLGDHVGIVFGNLKVYRKALAEHEDVLCRKRLVATVLVSVPLNLRDRAFLGAQTNGGGVRLFANHGSGYGEVKLVDHLLFGVVCLHADRALGHDEGGCDGARIREHRITREDRPSREVGIRGSEGGCERDGCANLCRIDAIRASVGDLHRVARNGFPNGDHNNVRRNADRFASIVFHTRNAPCLEALVGGRRERAGGKVVLAQNARDGSDAALAAVGVKADRVGFDQLEILVGCEILRAIGDRIAAVGVDTCRCAVGGVGAKIGGDGNKRLTIEGDEYAARLAGNRKLTARENGGRAVEREIDSQHCTVDRDAAVGLQECVGANAHARLAVGYGQDQAAAADGEPVGFVLRVDACDICVHREAARTRYGERTLGDVNAKSVCFARIGERVCARERQLQRVVGVNAGLSACGKDISRAAVGIAAQRQRLRFGIIGYLAVAKHVGLVGRGDLGSADPNAAGGIGLPDRVNIGLPRDRDRLTG